jgi:hypothetical protein
LGILLFAELLMRHGEQKLNTGYSRSRKHAAPLRELAPTDALRRVAESVIPQSE